jgi:hypothetical protein
MEAAINRLVLKANRSLGSRLGEIGLVGIDALDEANEIFVTRLREGILKEASLLRVLLYDLQAFPESDLFSHQIENDRVGAISLDAYQVQDEVVSTVSLDECLATWTVPIDHWHGTTFLASAYQPSEFVRQFWSERIESRVSWMACPFGELENFFERCAQARLEEAEGVKAN